MDTLLAASAKNMLKEAFEGPANPNETRFTNNEANSGIFGVLKSVSAELWRIRPIISEPSARY